MMIYPVDSANPADESLLAIDEYYLKPTVWNLWTYYKMDSASGLCYLPLIIGGQFVNALQLILPTYSVH